MCDSGGHCLTFLLLIIGFFEFGRRYVTDRFEQTFVVEPAVSDGSDLPEIRANESVSRILESNGSTTKMSGYDSLIRHCGSGLEIGNKRKATELASALAQVCQRLWK